MPDRQSAVIVIGQGLAGSAVAWHFHWAGFRVCLVDQEGDQTASRVAAGLITPVTGRRLTLAPDFELTFAAAQAFYRRVQETTATSDGDVPLIRRQPAVRLFADDIERQLFLNSRCAASEGHASPLFDEAGILAGIEMPHAARVDVIRYLETTRSWFQQRGGFFPAAVDVAVDLELTADGVRIPRLGLEADYLVFCQGFQQTGNPWFPGIPDGPSRGEILKVRFSEWSDDRVVHRGVWIAPEQDDGQVGRVFLAGATYDRTDLVSGPTLKGRDELLSGLSAITEERPEVCGHRSAVRAGMRNRLPVVAIHPDRPQLAILNGLGSRGALLAPVHAEKLLSLISTSQARDVTGRGTARSSHRKSLTQLAHAIVRRALRQGDSVIDATAGNGHDTVFLAECVGGSGRVTAIDLQPEAIAATSARLQSRAATAVSLLQGDHGRILSDLEDKQSSARAIMFNLGYLPGGDKTVTTRVSTTVAAVSAATRLLSNGGVLTLIGYRGHPGGREETEAVGCLISGLDPSGYQSDLIEGDPGNPDSPVLLVIRRGRFS